MTVNKDMLIFDLLLELRGLVRLLVQKGIISDFEVNCLRERLKSSPKYREVFENYQKLADTAEFYGYYEKNLQACLQKIQEDFGND